MSKGKQLSADEERVLFKAWKDGDEDAGNVIVESFRGWATTIAANYNRGVLDEELLAAALEGLADSMRLFDLKRKVNGKSVRFASFARIVVNQTIQRQLTARARSQDHLAFCGGSLPENLTDTMVSEEDNGEQAECVSRLMKLILKHDGLPARSKEVLGIFIRNPSSTLKTAGEQLGITREGVRQHLLKIRAAVAEDSDLRDAAEEAGLNLV